MLNKLKSTASDIILGKKPDPYDASYTIDDISNSSGFYTVKILSSINGAVLARIPESFSLGFSPEWSPLASSGNSTLFKTLNLVLNETYGFHLKNKKMTSQVWEGNAPISFTLPLEFRALSSAESEVVMKFLTIIKMGVPSETKNGFLQPPGPNVFGSYTGSGDIIQLMIGRALHISDLIITNIDSSFTTTFDPLGKPLSMVVNVTFKTMYSVTTNDIQKWFMISKSTPNDQNTVL